MSTQTRAGVRAAKTLLSLVDENSDEELAAAESILGSDKDLTNILQLLRKYKEHAVEPLSVERLRDIVRREILDLHLSVKAMVEVRHLVLGDEVARTPSPMTVENVLAGLLGHIEATSASPSRQIEALARLLVHGAAAAGSEQVAKVDSLLHDLTVQALVENLVMFPTLHELARLRTIWAPNPLPYQPHESRQRLATRLLADADRLAGAHVRDITVDLLCAGLRGPADSEIAALRATKTRKAHGS
jgi:hypothetical protein